MKKILAILTVLSVFALGMSFNAAAQDSTAAAPAAAKVDSAAGKGAQQAAAADEGGFHKALKQKFIEGGAAYMASVAFCLIFGLAFAIERILYLSLGTTDTKKLLAEIESALDNGGIEAAKEVCRNTRGPVASIFYQGISHYDEGSDIVEKTISSYGSVQLGLMEKNLTWISLFIGLAPMLGFLGTVVGMIQAFDKIQQVGDISATVVAGGIKVALLTTLAGLIVAIILQLFYNYILAKIDGLTNEMEDSSITLVDIVVKYAKKNA